MSHANATHPNMTKHEAELMALAISRALFYGWSISVHDGEEWAAKRVRDAETLWPLLASVEAETLKFRDRAGNEVGSAYVVYGNGPGELFADYSGNGRFAEWNAFAKFYETQADTLAAM